MPFGAPTDPNDAVTAVEWFRERVPLAFDDLEAEAAIDGLSFRVAGVTQLEVVTSVFDALERALEEGTTFEDFQAEIGDAIEVAWGGEIPGRLETIFRTNLQTAYAAGRYSEQYGKEAKKARPYVRLDVTEDSRTSDICEDLIGIGAVPKDGAFMATHHPPLHHECRTQEVDLTPEEAQEMGVEEDPPDSETGEGFGGVPDFGWEPDLAAYPEELQDIAEERLSDGD